jgi:anti-sigma regulatory factor (Ser/Thr protein kinase)
MVKKSFKPNLEAVKKIQDFVADNLKRNNSNKNQVFKINLLIEEIIVNIVSYAFNDTKKGIINIEINTLNNKLLLKISDNGIAFNPFKDKDPDINAPLENRSPGGLGIFFVKQIAKDINYSYENGQNTISLTIEY